MFKKIKIFFVGLVFLAPFWVSANYYSLPIDTSDSEIYISSWFDHDGTASTSMTKYTGTEYTGNEAHFDYCDVPPQDGSGCYDEHYGTDYTIATSTENAKEVKAAADGVVHRVKWQVLGDEDAGYGFHIGIYHEDYDQSTVYGHVASTSMVVLDQDVVRGQKVASSSDTGVGGHHLHFGVYDGDCYSLASAKQMDPYGWWGEGADPRTNENGYLWTTDPPSFAMASTVPNTISSDQTWRGNIVINGVVTVNSGVTLNIDSGTVVKFQTTTSRLVVNGTLDTQNYSTSTIYFTSYKDDSVGGDTNGDGPSSGAAENWCDIKIGSTGSSTISNAVVRYGGYRYCSYVGDRSYANIYNKGGMLNISDSEVYASYSSGYVINSHSGTTTITDTEIYGSAYGLLNDDGAVNISDSDIHDNSTYGFASIQPGGTMSVVNTSFSNNTSGLGFVNGGLDFAHLGNSASGTGVQGFVLHNGVFSDVTWHKDNIPYVINGVLEIYAGNTVNIEPGVVIKFKNNTSGITVSGILDAQGSTTSPIYFTSINDDTIGGDTGGDATSTPAAGDWKEIKIAANASSTITNAVVRYGGRGYYGSDSYSNIYNNGGVLDVITSEVATSSYFGITTSSGTTTVAYAEIHSNPYGLYFTGGSGTSRVATSSIHGNSSYGILNGTATTLDAENNFWGIAGGPNDSGGRNPGADKVSNYVDYDPWLDEL